MHQGLQRAALIILQSNTNIALLHAPHSHPKYRLKPDLFTIGLNRFLVLPSSVAHAVANVEAPWTSQAAISSAAQNCQNMTP
eukprot:4813472-Ditylum_brightwellii.AAC.1